MDKFEDRSTRKRKKRENKKHPYKKTRKKLLATRLRKEVIKT